ncbi:MAG: tRNA (adenosine(37)-N6)-dimethylallyltransferase MiaA [Magnetococcales bacterium]|nr:tRNA (adenosine(37)-N6)-dimethylallyltransferase MiaA [Magnetococcales bacterium]
MLIDPVSPLAEAPPQGPVIFLMGPTASGKSDVGMALAKRYSLEIVNADSVQIYRGFSIGAAKPGDEERSQVRHHLLDRVAPPEVYSADRYREEAWGVIRDCHSRRVIPLFVGGSGLYFRAVECGLATMPSMDPSIREGLRQEGLRWGWPALHDRLKQCDPELAQRIPEGDSHRIVQGLAVVTATGIPLTLWQQRQPPPPRLSVLKLAFSWPRALLYERIDARFDQMLALGLLDEIETLWKAGYDRDHPAMKAVGYRQLFPFFDGHCTLDMAVDHAKRESRRYAKRQVTWFKREPELMIIPWDNQSLVFDRVEAFLGRNRL